MSLGENIKTYRQKLHLSQEKIAELVGVSRQAVTKWESGQSTPNSDNLCRLSEIFHITVEQLTAEPLPPAVTPSPHRLHLPDAAAVRKQIYILLGFAAAFYLCCLCCELPFIDWSQTALLGFFIKPFCASDSYLLGWLAHENLLWIALAVILLPLLFYKYLFSAAALTGFALGLLFGEAFGPNPAGAYYGNTHYGWIIWIGIFLACLLIGAVLQKLHTKGKLFRHS